MWNWAGGHTFFHAFTKYRLLQMQLRGMSAEQFDGLRVFVLRPGERTPLDSGLTVGQLTTRHRDDDAFAIAHPATGREHAVIDVDKQLDHDRIVFTVDAK